MNIIVVGDPGGRDDEGMKRVNKHLRDELRALGHECVIDNGFSWAANRSVWDKIVFTAGPTKNTLYKVAMMRLLHPRSEIILCGLMPNIEPRPSFILKRCVDRIVSENPLMLSLGECAGIPVIQQTAATFSFEKFLRGRDRTKPKDTNKPLHILHVGHLNAKRNVHSLAVLCRRLGFSITFLVSSTEKHEPQERRKLEDAGAEIIAEYQEDLFEFYQRFDLYAFPVVRPDAAIAMPLSIVEALLAGLNVVSTDFGEVSNYFAACDNVKIVSDLDQLDAPQLETLAARPIMDIGALQNFDSLQFAKAIAGQS